MANNKKGWIRILEATIGVMLVSSVLLVVYVNQQPPQFITSEDYIYNLQKQLLLDIASQGDLRGYVLNGSNSSLDSLDDFLHSKIPDAFGFHLAVCSLAETGVCKLDTDDVAATRSKNVFAEEVIVSADFGGYVPKKVRLFVWENR